MGLARKQLVVLNKQKDRGGEPDRELTVADCRVGVVGSRGYCYVFPLPELRVVSFQFVVGKSCSISNRDKMNDKFQGKQHRSLAEHFMI